MIYGLENLDQAIMPTSESEEYNLNTINHTYNVQDEQRRYRLKRYVKQVGTVLAKKKEGEFAEEGDPLLNYDIDGENRIARSDRQEEADPERYYKEQREVVNINSRFRQRKVIKPINQAFLKNHEESDYLLKNFWDAEENDFKNLEKLVKELNRLGELDDECFVLFRLDSQSPLKPGRFEVMANSPSTYRFQLPKGLNNIKTIRLLSSEIPGCLPGVTIDNNLIIIDLVKVCQDLKCNCGVKAIEYNQDYVLPYIVVQIPPGNYEVEELAETMEDRINQSIAAYTCVKDSLFEIQADVETDAFRISLRSKCDASDDCDHGSCKHVDVCERERHCSERSKCERSIKCDTKQCNGILKFRFRFCDHPRVEELSLWYLLGFPVSGSPGLVTNWSNLVPVKTSKHFSKVINLKPFRPIDLNPFKYIYLVIKGLGTISDSLIDNVNLFAKVEIGPKPTEATGRTLYNTFVNNPKIFLETPLRLIESLDISWIDAWCQSVDFHNQEHSFTLEFVLYLDILVDSNFSSLRGVRDPTSFTESALRH